MSISQQVLDYVARLPPRSHAILYYTTDKMHSEIFKAYFEGARKQHQAVHIISSSRGIYERFLRKTKIDFIPLEGEGALAHVQVDRIYSPHPSGIAKNIVNYGREGLRKVEQAGFEGLRLYVLSDGFDANTQTLPFERTLGRNFSISVSMICSYSLKNNRRKSCARIRYDLIKTHGHVIFQGLAGTLISED